MSRFLIFAIFYFLSVLARSLGEAGEIEPETEGMLIENGVDFDEFPQQVMYFKGYPTVLKYWNT